MTAKSLRFLLVEDMASSRDTFVSQMRNHSVRPVPDRNALTAVLNAHSDFEIALVDLNFSRTDPLKGQVNEVLGPVIVESIAQRVPRAIVVAYSGHADLLQQYRDDCLRRGADLVCHRSELWDGEAKAIAIVTRANAARAERIRAERPCEPVRPPRVRALVEALQLEVGDLVLREAAAIVQPDSRSDEYDVLAGGYSGDWVVQFHSSIPGRQRVAWVLKVSRSAERLYDELSGSPLLGEPVAAAAADRGVGVMSLSAGWHGLAAPFVANAPTLRRIARDGDVDSVQRAFASLQRMLSDRFLSAVRADAPGMLVPARALTWRFAAEVWSAMDQLSPWIAESGVQDRMRNLFEWIESGAMARWLVVESGTLVCHSHGDLHLSNILWDEDRATATAIDFARGRMAPRFEDLAALFVSLLCDVWLRGTSTSLGAMDAAAFGSSLASAEWADATALTTLLANHFGAQASGSAFAPILASLVKSGAPGEWKLALRLQALRYARFGILPPAVRLLLLSLAAELGEG